METGKSYHAFFALYDGGMYPGGPHGSDRLLDVRLNQFCANLHYSRADATRDNLNTTSCCSFNSVAIAMLAQGLLDGWALPAVVIDDDLPSHDAATASRPPAGLAGPAV